MLGDECEECDKDTHWTLHSHPQQHRNKQLSKVSLKCRFSYLQDTLSLQQARNTTFKKGNKTQQQGQQMNSNQERKERIAQWFLSVSLRQREIPFFL